MDYPLCDRTVTVYRNTGGQIHRQVVEGCFLQLEDRIHTDNTGHRPERTFLLVMPGNTQQVFAGDRIYDGVGPVIESAQWDRFLPVLVPGLVQAAYAKPCYLDGRLCHTEAG